MLPTEQQGDRALLHQADDPRVVPAFALQIIDQFTASDMTTIRNKTAFFSRNLPRTISRLNSLVIGARILQS